MTLGSLIEQLEKANPRSTLKNGFANPHSYRGYYEQLAFEPAENVTVASMLKCAKESLEKTFCGYKGGFFIMHDYTDVWLANYSDCGDMLSPLLISYMLKDTVQDQQGRAE